MRHCLVFALLGGLMACSGDDHGTSSQDLGPGQDGGIRENPGVYSLQISGAINASISGTFSLEEFVPNSDRAAPPILFAKAGNTDFDADPDHAIDVWVADYEEASGLRLDTYLSRAVSDDIPQATGSALRIQVGGAPLWSDWGPPSGGVTVTEVRDNGFAGIVNMVVYDDLGGSATVAGNIEVRAF